MALFVQQPAQAQEGTSARTAEAQNSVILVTDDAHACHALALALGATVGLRLLGHCSIRRSQAALLRRYRPDAVLVDQGAGPEHVVARIREARVHAPQATVVLLAASGDRRLMADAMDAGGHAVIVKDVDPSSMAVMVQEITRGTVFHRFVPSASREPNGLTSRECDVLRWVAVGARNNEVAQRLMVSEETVKFHLSNLYRKLQVTNRTAAGGWAHAHGMVAEEDAPRGGDNARALREADLVGMAPSRAPIRSTPQTTLQDASSQPATARWMPGAARRVFQTLPGDTRACGEARAELKAWAGDLEPEVYESARLAISEMITTCLADTAPGAAVELEMSMTPEGIRIAVASQATRFTSQESPYPEAGGGLGLYLLDRLADRWGVTRGSRTCIWIELDRS
jgi:DNA-binding NarL/FixJ family response regulator/anti-sigma regulatory factor (Ser/Thr protein kinase)